MSSFKVRVATKNDAEAIRDIYAPYIETTAISFEREVPSVDEIRTRIEARRPMYPWLVAETISSEAEIAGYIYAGRFAARAAYDWSVESSLYIAQQYARQGIGRLMYGRLLPILKQQNFRMVYAGIALPNEPSVGLHEAMGFKKVANFDKAGFKFGSWHDVGWWALDLHPEFDEKVAKLIPFADLDLDLDWRKPSS